MQRMGFDDRILLDRTRSLAARGVDAGRTAPSGPGRRLVCIAGGRHVALPVELLAAVLAFFCHPVPLQAGRAAEAMLGVAQIRGQLVSVLDLARLLAMADPGARDGGVMLLLRGITPTVALRVDQVLGVLTLRPAEEPGHALLPEEPDQGLPPLVTLLDEAMLGNAVGLLDGRPSFPPNRAGA